MVGTTTMGIDDFLRQVEQDELQDAAETQKYMAISSYAKARGIAPQQVHYHVRKGNLTKTRCACGRFVIEIAAADHYLGFKRELNQYEQREADKEGGAATD